MPIYDNQYGQRVIHFGTGDIGIHTMSDPDAAFANQIGLREQSPPKEIGLVDNDGVGKPSTEIGVSVVLRFDKIESLGALVDRLNVLRDEMASQSVVANDPDDAEVGDTSASDSCI